MGWRFRKSFTVVPGLRLNLSKSGLSASIGGAPFTLNVGPRGLMGTASVPGTGISYRQHFSSGAAHVADTPVSYGTDPVPVPAPVPTPVPTTTTFFNTAPIEEIHSASTELLTSATLKQLKELIQTAFRQQQEINSDLDKARDAKIRTQHRYDSWERGFLFKRLLKQAFAKRKEENETETARVDELEQQFKLSKISTYIEIDGEQAALYYRLRDEFAALSDCAAIWDVKTRQATDRFHERTTANVRLGRERVRFGLGSCDLIEWEQRVPHLQNAKGGDIYLYPGFILYRAAREAFSLIEYHDAPGNVTSVSFQEEDGVPSDSQVIGQTWAKANKDGSRDRRFANNYQIPIARYGAVVLKSDHGLWEEFQFSNVQKLVNFANALNSFTSSFARVANA
jgi:hypothetical protein